MASPNTNAFQPTGLSYALSVGATTVNVTPVGFNSGSGNIQVYNSGTNPVLVYFYPSAVSGGSVPLTFPVTGTPPAGQFGTVVAPGATLVFGISANADSLAAIGSAAGPAILYFQRGDGI